MPMRKFTISIGMTFKVSDLAGFVDLQHCIEVNGRYPEAGPTIVDLSGHPRLIARRVGAGPATRLCVMHIQCSGFNSPSSVGKSSDTVGCMCTARCTNV